MSITRKFDSNTTVFIPCNCKNEILSIEYDHSLQIADMAIYYSYNSFINSLSLWQRLTNIVGLFLGKRTYGDQIVLDHSQLIELKKFLDSIDL